MWTSLAAAGPSKEDLQTARTLFNDGLADEAAGNYAAALAKFERVQGIKTSPSLRFHLALCEEKLGHLVAALSDYESARANARVENNEQVMLASEEPIARLTELVPRVTLKLDAPPATYEIQVDERNLTAVGFGNSIPLDPGEHTLHVRAPGLGSFRHTIKLALRERVVVPVVFTKDEPPRARALPPPTDTRAVHPLRPWAIASAAGAVVFVGAGVGMFFGAAAVHANEFEKCQRKEPCGGGAVNVLDWSAGAAWLVGAGLAVTSVVLWTRPAKRSSVALVVRPGGLAIEGVLP